MSDVMQTGDGNGALTVQLGEDHISTISQAGNGNGAIVFQSN
jgi:hypothetical protein